MKNKKRNERRSPARKTGQAGALGVAPSSPLLRWADYDSEYKGNNRFQVYATKADQRGNRPDLKPIPVLVVPLTEECISEIRHKMAEAFNGSYDGHLHKDDLTAMLRAIGIVANNRDVPTPVSNQKTQ